MYTETFTFFLGHFCLDSPHLFSIPFIKSALLCAAAADVSPPTSGRRAGVGRELGVLASIHTTILPPHSPPQIPLAPQSLAAPRALIPYGYLGPILRQCGTTCIYLFLFFYIYFYICFLSINIFSSIDSFSALSKACLSFW